MKVRIKDKCFKEFISEIELKEIVRNIAVKLDERYRDGNPYYLVLMNGAFIFASDLLREVKTMGNIAFINYKSYVGMESTGSVKVIVPIPESVKGRDVVIIEDIVDSGLTMKYVMEDLNTLEPRSVCVVTCFSKPCARKYDLPMPLDYVGKEIGNEFIVGYGLDYDGQGRNLPAVYVLDE